MSDTRQRLTLAGSAFFLASSLVVAACGSQDAVLPGAGHAQNRAILHRSAEPTATASPIQLVPGTTVGVDVFPEGDTKTGGQGQTVNGIPCQKVVNEIFHHHVHLSLFVNGVQYAIPRGTGMKNPGTGHFVHKADCTYWLHTHDETGILHMEAPVLRSYTLHDYFYIWGEPLNQSNVAGYTGPITVFINGVQESVDPRTIVFAPYMEITLEVGSPVVPPPVYIFPPGYT